MGLASQLLPAPTLSMTYEYNPRTVAKVCSTTHSNQPTLYNCSHTSTRSRRDSTSTSAKNDAENFRLCYDVCDATTISTFVNLNTHYHQTQTLDSPSCSRNHLEPTFSNFFLLPADSLGDSYTSSDDEKTPDGPRERRGRLAHLDPVIKNLVALTVNEWGSPSLGVRRGLARRAGVSLASINMSISLYRSHNKDASIVVSSVTHVCLFLFI